jgi:hypothetical protein
MNDKKVRILNETIMAYSDKPPYMGDQESRYGGYEDHSDYKNGIVL